MQEMTLHRVEIISNHDKNQVVSIRHYCVGNYRTCQFVCNTVFNLEPHNWLVQIYSFVIQSITRIIFIFSSNLQNTSVMTKF